MQLTAKYIAASTLIFLCCLATRSADSQSRNDRNNALPPFGHTFFCLRYPRECQPTGSTKALPVSPEARWRKMNVVNATVNADIAPKADPEQVDTHWRIAPAQGDCNDYAVTKRHELLAAGWPSSSLLLAEVTLLSTGEHHLILIVKGVEADWVLDNLNPAIERLAATRSEYAWDRIESAHNPKFWTYSFSGLG
jgi:predicted transglutaminase-like cysteine proteinase